MQFSIMQTRLAEETGLDVTADATKIKSWLNEAYRFLAGLREWSWMLSSSVIQTTADNSTPTAAITQNTTSVVLSAAVTTNLASDYWIQFSTADDWYPITAHTSSLVIQDLTYSDTTKNADNVTIAYTTGATAGSEVVTVSGNTISIQIETAVSTATQVKAAFDGDSDATALASCAISGTAGTAQTAPVAAAALAGTTALTISPAYAGATVTVDDCTIRRVYYSLASDVDRVIDVYEAIQDRQLTYVDPRELDYQVPDPTRSGTPYAYTLLGFDTSNQWRMHFYPIPDDVINIQYRYYKRVTDLSSDADIPVLPAKWHMGIVFTALAMFAHPYIDDSRMASAESRARQVVGEMMKQQSPLPDKHTPIQTWDSRRGTRPYGAVFPPDFDQYWRR